MVNLGVCSVPRMELGIAMTLSQNFKPTFGGHEKFVFRHGWLKKGVDALVDNPLVFTHEESLTTLGVGKNMVRSIRHWCLATGLVEETGRLCRIRDESIFFR